MDEGVVEKPVGATAGEGEVQRAEMDGGILMDGAAKA